MPSEASKENCEIKKIDEKIASKAFEKKDQSYLTASLDKFRRQKVQTVKQRWKNLKEPEVLTNFAWN